MSNNYTIYSTGRNRASQKDWGSGVKQISRCALFLIFGSLLLLSEPAVSAVFSETPLFNNDSYSTPQALGDATPLPSTLTGEIDHSSGYYSLPPTKGDVDFFSFNGPPNSWVKISIEGAATGKGTLWGPYLGLFNSSPYAQQVVGQYFEPKPALKLLTPANGTVTFGVSSCCDDWGFSGYNNYYRGTYEVTMSTFEVAENIHGRFVNQVTGLPISSGWGSIYQIDENGNEKYISSIQINPADGTFLITVDSYFLPLEVGSYIVCGYSDQYYPGECRTYTIAAGPDGGNIGDYALKSFPVRFSELTTCNISSQTSTCKYSVRLSNGSAQSIDNGALWSIVNVWDPVAGNSTFQSGKQTVSMSPSGTGTNSSKVLWFDYVVPGTVSEGTYMCPIFFYGQDPVNPYFKVIGSQNYNYNCIIKQGGVFKAMPANKSQLSPGAEAYKRAIEQKHGVKAIPPELPK